MDIRHKKNDFLNGEEHLIKIDERILTFASQNKIKLDSKNYHGWPERSLSWKNKGIKKQIQIYLDKDLTKYLIWGCAFKDTIFGHRYWWKTETITFAVSSDWEIIKKEFVLLKKTLDKITTSQLNRA